jgi:hypothetical protein
LHSFAIGFKGGQELSHENFTSEIAVNVIWDFYFIDYSCVQFLFVLKKKLNVFNAGAIAKDMDQLVQ